MEILALSGSIRVGSYNTALLAAISKLSLNNISVTLSESIECVPIFNSEIAESDKPEVVKALINKIRKSDGVIISSPEYAHGVTGVLKNVLDWLVSSDAIVLKPVVVASVSTSGLGGVRSYSSLVQILTAMNSNVIIEGSLCVPYASTKFDDALNLIDDLTKKRIGISLLAIQKAVNQGNNNI